MSRRRSDSTSNAHREIINQFMVEWDGLTSDNQGVIVMAATNRPRDLDDAVLRRLPRRILGNTINENPFFFLAPPPDIYIYTNNNNNKKRKKEMKKKALVYGVTYTKLCMYLLCFSS